MEKFEITILGCGSAKPTLRHAPSAQLVTHNSRHFLIDCGEGTQSQLMRAHCKFNRLSHIFISHLHGDHCYGLPGLLSTMGLAGLNGHLTVHLPEEGVALFKPLLDYSANVLEVEFAPYRYGNSIIYEDRSLTVNTVPLKHRLPCVGFVFREKQKLRHINNEMTRFHQVPVSLMQSIREGCDFVKQDGTVIPNEMLTAPPDPQRSYAYISDTLPLKAVANEVKGIDLLYHEATFLSNLSVRAKQTCHSTAAEAARIAKEAGVRRLVIGHFSSRYLNESPLLEEARQIFPETSLARELLTFEI